MPLIGCYSHKLNLAVSSYVGKETRRGRGGLVTEEADGHRPLVDKIDSVMGSLKTLKTAAMLSAKTP